MVCPLGDNLDDIAQRLFAGQRGLRHSNAWRPEQPLPLGSVDTPLPDDSDWPAEHRSRNNRLLAAALQRLAPTLDSWRAANPAARMGVVMGTSTSGISETEHALKYRLAKGEWPDDFIYYRHELGAPADFVAWWCGVDGPAYTLSTACTSSARALASASRLIKAGVCDAVIAGGADSLCQLTVSGFSSLDAVSIDPCKPFSAARSGINLGEGAALFLVTGESGGIQLKGYGETSDAHHISAPRPDGSGAHDAMAAALQMGGVEPSRVDYLNLHGTATRQNDSMEALAVARLFPEGVPCSSTKSLTGHTLGACGALEAAFCWLAMAHGRLPPHLDTPDPELPSLSYSQGEQREVRRTLSNAFAFGGNNIALLLEKAE
ncbi:3-oxoacyl-ACP synthase [Halomonas huangheensis]|nr:3-oxoacyl-ACP synthase [Halomonas huangheensis]